MAIFILPVKRIRISAAGGWRFAFRFWTGPVSVKQAYPIDGLSVACSLTLANQSPPATPIDLSGYVSVSGGTALAAVPREVTAPWPQGDYDFVLRGIDPALDEDVFGIYSDPATSRVRVGP